MTRSALRQKIFEVTDVNFKEVALAIFQYQFSSNQVYCEYCTALGKSVQDTRKAEDIPFLPIELFKSRNIVSGNLPAQKLFTSSGTTRQQVSRHEVTDLSLYEESFFRTFKIFFGAPKDYCILALLPSYLERSGSSLVYMTEQLMKAGGNIHNGFYLFNHAELHSKLVELESRKQKTILLGVTFALLDFAEKFPTPLHHTTILETGGMKGQREEITREALHDVLKKSFCVETIWSEYGMTELLSQAYAPTAGKFHSPPWMKIFIRDINDPFQPAEKNTTGVINIIDFANLDSCCFLATADLGKLYDDGSFEVLGRMDNSDVRGCNLMWDGK